MKTYLKLLAVIFSFLSTQAFAQDKNDITGAWHYGEGGQEMILLFQDGYFTYTLYHENEFMQSFGGTYKVRDQQIEGLIEFDSKEKENVGNKMTASILNNDLKNGSLTLYVQNERVTWKRLGSNKETLAGVWQITDRMEEGNVVPIQRTGTRKTLKVLTGTRFQWFAIDPATKLFAGTGGGTYTFKDGKYTENIDFFSRDNTRVGAALVFDGKLEDGKWHHSGLSSKGDKIYEVWGRTPY